MHKAKRMAVVSPECVACGSCMKVCPRQAISVPKGIIAQVDPDKCIGCGKCSLECPARLISIHAKEVAYAQA